MNSFVRTINLYTFIRTRKQQNINKQSIMNNAEKLEEIKRLCQSIINYEADYIDDSNYEMAEMILAIINK